MSDRHVPKRERSPIVSDDYTIAPAVSLSAVDPTADASRFDALVSAITTDVLREGRRTVRLGSRNAGILPALAAFSRTTIAAAAAVMLIASASLLVRPVSPILAPASMAESAGIPASLVEWTIAAQRPSATDLIDLLDRETMQMAKQP